MEDEWDDAMLSEIAALESRHLQHHPAASARPSPSPPPSSNWSCKSCTLTNDAGRATCLVCATPRGETFTSTSTSKAAKKTVQATLPFANSAPPRQVDAHVAPSPFRSQERELQLTSSRSRRAETPVTEPSPPEPVVRRAAGEDTQAKTRYLDILARSSFPEIDFEKAQHFVYPTNYSIRDYQLTIAEKALYHNTLVSLPTGLGKTLIAAVVMYNFYRWFPTGKIVFMAPTKPLVAQQIRACHEIMGIPLSDTAELQGNVPPAMRRVLWSSKRVFFCTPQSLQNDLRRGVCAAEKFVCIVVDEAHRATGNYAYCCVVQEIEAKTTFFRVLALSATPGAKFDVIQDVVTNLRISHIESRSADDPDVKKYTHARQEEVVVCRLGTQILEVKALFLKCFTPIVQRLLRGNIIQQGDPEKLSSWYVLQARERFRKSPNYASNRSAECDLALLIGLLHAKGLLTGHGLSSFRDQITNWIEERKTGKMSWSKREMLQSPEFQALESSLSVTPGANTSSNTASHPKLVKLREVLLEHFQRHAVGKSSTRAIVFTQYRASVSEIVALLRPLAPLLNVQPFIGQGASGKAKENKGQSQKVQQDIVRRFRLGEFNVLVATCIAEEGLDIGEVDLIVSFDALTSPVRMIQRMGRTGRKRVGRVIILVTEGDEQKKLARSASAAKTVSRALTTFKSRFTYSKCPRMIPTGICPQLSELEMKIPTFHASQVGGKNAFGAVDPKLWQLSEAERAEAEAKYFPSNFALSKRNKLFPIVGNRRHLLRPRPQGKGRKHGLLVGYSARSLILQSLVRKIHGVDEVLELDIENEEGASDEDFERSDREGVAVSNKGNSTETRQDRSSPSPKIHRRLRTASNEADTESDTGSPWREADPPSPPLAEDKGNDSFTIADESAIGLDMHFSPQFVDSSTQFASGNDEVFENEGAGNIQQGQPSRSDLEPAVKRQKLTTKHDSHAEPSEISTGESVKDTRPKKATISRTITGGGYISEGDNQSMSAPMSLTISAESPRPSCLENNDSEVNNPEQETAGAMSLTLSVESPATASRFDSSMEQQAACVNQIKEPTRVDLSNAESLTLSAESPRPLSMVCASVDQPGYSITTRDSIAVQRPPSTRQLQFDDTGNAERVTVPNGNFPEDITSALAPASTAEDGQAVETAMTDTGEPPAFSFALLPADGNGNFNGKDKEEQADEEPSAYSFALLPPSAATSNLGQPLEAEKSTDMDQTKPGVHDGDVATAHDKKQHKVDGLAKASVIDLTNECAKEEVKFKEEAPTKPVVHQPPTMNARVGVLQEIKEEPEQEEEEESCCAVCRERESYEDDPIVYCDGCNVAVHQFCYGIRDVSSDKWFCEVCTEEKAGGKKNRSRQLQCQLCPHRGGALKRTKCGRWVHVQCFLWIPELHVELGEDDALVLGELNRLDPDRKTLECSLCHSKKGKGIIQCAHKRCLVAFHVSCASFAHYRMDQLDPPEGDSAGTGTLFLAYCQIHRKSRAPYVAPNQQKTPPYKTTQARLPPKAMRVTSPSHLLASPPSAEAKQKFKCFRRLKQKYEASQSQMFSQARTSGSPAVTSPWQKRIRRSKRRRETARVLAAAYIEDIAQVRGGNESDDNEDDYGDDYKDGPDDSFINDSSQLLYSQSAVSPEEAGSGKAKKKRKKASPDMRAIYARSLFESQNSPLLLRRGGRPLGALPSQGIIRACLDEMHNGNDDLDTPSPRPRSRSRSNAEAKQSAAISPTANVSPTTAKQSDTNESVNEASALPNFNLLGAGVTETGETTPTKIELSKVKVESNPTPGEDSSMAPPNFNLLGSMSINDQKLSSTGVATASSMVTGDANAVRSLPSAPPKQTALSTKRADREKEASEDDLRMKIEANRLKALEKLQQRRQAKLKQTSIDSHLPSDSTKRMVSDHASSASYSGTSSVPSNAVRDETSPPSFSLLPLGNSSPQAVQHVVNRTADEPVHNEQPQHSYTIFVSSTFAGSRGFAHFEKAKRPGCSVDVEGSLEADILLSVRMGVLFVTGDELHALALAAPAQKLLKHPKVRTLLVMHKKLVVAVVHNGSDTSEVQRLQKLPNAKVIVNPSIEFLCGKLHDIAQEELVGGYELPSPSMCGSDASSEGSQGLDAEFGSRLAFFRTIPALSLGTALSLSFRFKNFTAAQVPVHKFNEMHWRRMLPWISDHTATEIRRYIVRNVPKS